MSVEQPTTVSVAVDLVGKGGEAFSIFDQLKVSGFDVVEQGAPADIQALVIDANEEDPFRPSAEELGKALETAQRDFLDGSPNKVLLLNRFGCLHCLLGESIDDDNARLRLFHSLRAQRLEGAPVFQDTGELVHYIRVLRKLGQI